MGEGMRKIRELEGEREIQRGKKSYRERRRISFRAVIPWDILVTKGKDHLEDQGVMCRHPIEKNLRTRSDFFRFRENRLCTGSRRDE